MLLVLLLALVPSHAATRRFRGDVLVVVVGVVVVGGLVVEDGEDVDEWMGGYGRVDVR